MTSAPAWLSSTLCKVTLEREREGEREGSDESSKFEDNQADRQRGAPNISRNGKTALISSNLRSHKEDIADSVTRFGDLLDFGQLFKAFGNNLFVQIIHILNQFL